MTQSHIEVIQGLVGLVLIVIAYAFFWKPAMYAMFRQHLFTIRDELFLEGARGTIDFNDELYGKLRYIIQSTIRSTGEFNILHLLLYHVFRRQLSDGRSGIHQEFQRQVELIQDQKRAAVYRHYHNELLKSLTSHTLRVMCLPFIGFVLVAVLVRFHAAIVQRIWLTIQAAAAPALNRYVDAAVGLGHDDGDGDGLIVA